MKALFQKARIGAMDLRLIVSILALLALLSLAGGGLLYVSSIRKSAYDEARRQAETRVQMIAGNFSSSLTQNTRAVGTLAGMKELEKALVEKNGESLDNANQVLDHFRATLGVDVCYLIDRQGNTLASSNRSAADSFVGKNFDFRPYFQKGIQGEAATYLALGATSLKRGAYSGHPVVDSAGNILGVAVIKASIDLIEEALAVNPGEIVLVTGPEGVVFISSRKDWLFGAVNELSPDQARAVTKTRQFGRGPWEWIGLSRDGEQHVTHQNQSRFLAHRRPLENFEGWEVSYLQDMAAISQRVSAPVMRATGLVVMAASVVIGLIIVLLYSRALREISRRRTAEQALRKSEERYRFIYHNTPAMLHSLDPNGVLINVSEHWTRALGYPRDEIIGRPLSDFLTPESARLMKDGIFPEFFRTGACSDIPYQFVKKNGEVFDVLLSAIGERDEKGAVIRSLAVSVDVSEQKRVEAALRDAQEKLSRYSRDLERQVFRRTEEISGILNNTPDVVYIKDTRGRFVMINPRYEELFGINNEDVRGRTQQEILPKEFADSFQESDNQVLEEKRPVRAEYRVLREDGMHDYLSVKFPIYDEHGRISKIGGISTDVTELKQAQDKLRRLSNRIMESQEAERSAIARELHDELGQILTALRLDAVWLKNRVETADPVAAERAMAMVELIEKSIEDVRGIALRLRPGVLDDLGLVDALDWLAEDFERRSGVTCVFESDAIEPLSNAKATAAYRITQEALTNVARHAGAERVSVRLEALGPGIRLTVSDVGGGFEPDRVDETESLGIAGMRERAFLAGGTLAVQSAPGGGTAIVFTIDESTTDRGEKP